MKFGIGASLRRKEDPALITGRGRYVADIRPDGTAWAHVLRSPIAHGTFSFTDLETPRGMPGVLAVLTAEDFADLGPIPCRGIAMVSRKDGDFPEPPHHPVMADGTVRFVGEPMAVVIAATPGEARDAAESIGFDFQELPAVADIATATAEGAPDIRPEFPGNIAFDWRIGDREGTDLAFAEAETVVSVDLVNNRVVTNYMETRGAIGEYDASTGRYTLTAGTQGAHNIQALLGKVMGIGRERLRVITPDVGGGFGTKLMLSPESAMVLVAAETTGRPVTWVADRTEHFLGDYQGRGHLSHAELALDGKGRILGLRVDTLADMGAYYSQMGPFIPINGSYLLAGTYRFPVADVRVRGVFTNTVPTDAYRGAGRPEAAYLIERLVDKAARETGVSPEKFRSRNFIPPSKMPFRTATGRVYDTGEFDGHMKQALQEADWAGFKARARAAKKDGRIAGIGIASYIEACSGGGPERASVKVEADGSVTVAIGSQSTGQGHATAYSQIVSEHLGVDPDRVKVIQGDTDLVESGSGTGGSRSIPVGGAALSKTSEKLATRIREVAADLLEAGPEDLELDGGTVRIVGTDRSVGLDDVARKSAEDGGSLKRIRGLAARGPHLSERHPRRRGRDRPGDLRHPAGALHGGRRLRRHAQSADARGPGAWRHRARGRPGAHGADGLRSRFRPAPHRDVPGLRDPARLGHSRHRLRHAQRPLDHQRARHEGGGRGRHDRCLPGGGQRGGRRAAPGSRHHAYRHADHLGIGLAGAQRGLTPLTRISTSRSRGTPGTPRGGAGWGGRIAGRWRRRLPARQKGCRRLPTTETRCRAYGSR